MSSLRGLVAGRPFCRVARPVRLLTALLCLAATSCTSTTVTGQSAGQDTSTGRATAAGSVATASGTASATSGTGSGGAPMPSAPALAAVPARAIPACAHVTCRAVAVVPNARPGIDLVLVRAPDSSDIEQVAYLLTVDARGVPLGSVRLAHGGFFFDSSLSGPTCDAVAHCFVPAAVGAHGGVINVVAVSATGRLTDLSAGGRYTADTPDLRGVDLDGDGIDEIVGTVNDYQPDYATGTNYWIVRAWQGTRYVDRGCRKLQLGEKLPGEPVSPASCPG